MMSSLLFIFYLLLFSFILVKSKWVRHTQLPVYIILGLFFIKIVAGCLYGYIHLNSIYGIKTDTWKFYTESLPATDILKKNPLDFFRFLFSNGYTHESSYISTENNYWNDLKHNIMIAFMSICNLFSGKNYYINIIFYNVFVMMGCMAFYRFCMAYFSAKAKWIVLIALCIPSFVFWSSGFHKEGILFTSISFLLWSSYQMLHTKSLFKPSISITISIILILLLRNYLLLFLIPFLSWWILLHYYPKYKHWLGFAMVSVAILIVFISKDSLLHITANANNQFKQLGGKTTNYNDSLLPTAKGFLHYTPTALDNAFLKPGINDLNLTYFPSFIENILFYILILLVLVNFKKTTHIFTNHLLLFIGLTTFLFLGYSVPVTGAIIRYKAILLPFLFVALCTLLSYKKGKSNTLFL